MHYERFFEAAYQDYAQALNCPDPLLLEAYRSASLDSAERVKIQTHLEHCPACQAALTALQDHSELTFDLPEAPPQLEPLPAQTQTLSAQAHPPHLQVGQIWNTPAHLDLATVHLAATGQVHASLQTLFVLTQIGPWHLGRYRELQVCPLSELVHLASSEDLLLQGDDTPFDEPLMLECWNAQPALDCHLGQYWGQLSDSAQADLQAFLAGQPLPEAKRGGTIISEQGPHARFRHLERASLAYLAEPLQALQTLKSLTQSQLLKIRPKGFQTPQPQTKPQTKPQTPAHFLARLLPSGPQDSVLAAASSSFEAAASLNWDQKERLQLGAEAGSQLQVELWLEGENLEFLATTLEQEPVSGLQIQYSAPQARLQQIETDALGTAWIPLSELFPEESLLVFMAPNLGIQGFYPIHWAP